MEVEINVEIERMHWNGRYKYGKREPSTQFGGSQSKWRIDSIKKSAPRQIAPTKNLREKDGRKRKWKKENGKNGKKGGKNENSRKNTEDRQNICRLFIHTAV